MTKLVPDTFINFKLFLMYIMFHTCNQIKKACAQAYPQQSKKAGDKRGNKAMLSLVYHISILQGSTCLEGGAYLLNYAGCSQCQHKGPLGESERVREEEEGEEEQITFKREYLHYS